MTINNRIAALQPEIAGWRQFIHAHPEIRYEEEKTAAFVAERLRSFGVDEVVTGLGKTGVVAVVRGRQAKSGKVIGLRADMDALPIHEATDKPYKSTVDGKMHACGHDGHTAMLLGAAKYLAETRHFDGTAVLVFQPAEEGSAGALAMIHDGLLERFGIQEIYGLHNRPGVPVGHFGIRKGAQLAASDFLEIRVEGLGGHAARPQHTADPVVCGAHIVTALQSIVARNIDPLDSAVVSLTVFKAGDVNNVIPQRALLQGTVRTFKAQVRDEVIARIRRLAVNTGEAFGCKVEVELGDGYPALINHDANVDFAAGVARQFSDHVDADFPPSLGGEDFAYFLERIPGAFMVCGNGDTAKLHHPAYDFNDEAISAGVSYWVKLVETRCVP